jgi:hypothetical protein
MKRLQLITLIPIATLLIMLSGCEKEGPAEQAGENIDEAVEEMQTRPWKKWNRQGTRSNRRPTQRHSRRRHLRDVLLARQGETG